MGLDALGESSEGVAGLTLELRTHGWAHWRSLYFRDPEGNQVELVCYDPTV